MTDVGADKNKLPYSQSVCLRVSMHPSVLKKKHTHTHTHSEKGYMRRVQRGGINERNGGGRYEEDDAEQEAWKGKI